MSPTANGPALANRRNIGSRLRLLRRVRAEFEEMPCLRLTSAQAQRLFGLRADVCERLLATLVREGALTRGPDARFGMRDDVWDARVSRMVATATR